MSMIYFFTAVADTMSQNLQRLRKRKTRKLNFKEKTIKRHLLFISAIFLLIASLSAQDEKKSTEKLPLAFSLTTDFAYYPLSAPVVSEKTHFAPLTGIYSCLEGRTTGHAVYTIPTPFGDNPLTKGNNLSLDGYLELSPVSIKPGFSISFTPIAFLVFNAGLEAGTGWNLLGIEGMGKWDPSSSTNYSSLVPFASWYYHFWAKGTFQFDTGALISGDWTHVVMLASYKAEYVGISGQKNQDLWCWQGSNNQVNGWKYETTAVLAYQMPLVLKRAGIMAEFSGYYNNNAFKTGSTYDGNFMTVDLSPLLQFQFGEKDSLAVLFNFSSRRGYSTNYSKSYEQPFLTKNSREWYFRRLALSWTHNF